MSILNLTGFTAPMALIAVLSAMSPDGRQKSTPGGNIPSPVSTKKNNAKPQNLPPAPTKSTVSAHPMNQETEEKKPYKKFPEDSNPGIAHKNEVSSKLSPQNNQNSANLPSYSSETPGANKSADIMNPKAYEPKNRLVQDLTAEMSKMDQLLKQLQAINESAVTKKELEAFKTDVLSSLKELTRLGLQINHRMDECMELARSYSASKDFCESSDED